MTHFPDYLLCHEEFFGVFTTAEEDEAADKNQKYTEYALLAHTRNSAVYRESRPTEHWDYVLVSPGSTPDTYNLVRPRRRQTIVANLETGEFFSCPWDEVYTHLDYLVGSLGCHWDDDLDTLWATHPDLWQEVRLVLGRPQKLRTREMISIVRRVANGLGFKYVILSAHQNTTRRDRGVRISGCMPEQAAQIGEEATRVIGRGSRFNVDSGFACVWA